MVQAVTLQHDHPGRFLTINAIQITLTLCLYMRIADSGLRAGWGAVELARINLEAPLLAAAMRP